MVDWDSPDKHGVDGWFQFNSKMERMQSAIRNLESRIEVLENRHTIGRCVNCGHLFKDHNLYRESGTGAPASRCYFPECKCPDYEEKK